MENDLGTISTSIYAYLQAELPIILSPLQSRYHEFFPKSFFIHLWSYEITSLRNLLENDKYDKRIQIMKKKKYLYSIEFNIKKFINFLDRLK